MHALLYLDMAFHDSATQKPEEVICALDRDCAAVEAAISHRGARTLRTLATAVLATVFAFQRSWETSMVALALSPLVGGATIMVAKAAQHGAQEAHASYAAAGALASQAIGRIRTVVALQAERRLLESFIGIVAGPRRVFVWGPAVTAAAHSAAMAAEIVTSAPPPHACSQSPEWTVDSIPCPHVSTAARVLLRRGSERGCFVCTMRMHGAPPAFAALPEC